jgi:hypothetical protein
MCCEVREGNYHDYTFPTYLDITRRPIHIDFHGLLEEMVIECFWREVSGNLALTNYDYLHMVRQ